jgi:hypothetical protein
VKKIFQEADMLKTIIGIVVGVCFGSAQAIAAAETTWFCSALMNKTDTKPTAFKFQIKGGELIDFNLWENAFEKKWENQQVEKHVTYKLVEDTVIGLVAMNSETHEENRKAEVYVQVILINKVSGDFRQIGFTTNKSEELFDHDGTCSASK